MKFLSTLLLLTPIALALPVTEAPIEDAALETRQNCYSRCGSTCYSSSQVTAARNAGYNYYRQDGTAGSSNYPHQYNNFEGFEFLVPGPYQEFPIRTSGAYTGGSPGADRVVFNTKGQRAGEITHSGASGNAFVACDGWDEDDRRDRDSSRDNDRDSSSGARMLSGGLGMWAVTFVAGLRYI